MFTPSNQKQTNNIIICGLVESLSPDLLNQFNNPSSFAFDGNKSFPGKHYQSFQRLIKRLPVQVDEALSQVFRVGCLSYTIVGDEVTLVMTESQLVRSKALFPIYVEILSVTPLINIEVVTTSSSMDEIIELAIDGGRKVRTPSQFVPAFGSISELVRKINDEGYKAVWNGKLDDIAIFNSDIDIAISMFATHARTRNFSGASVASIDHMKTYLTQMLNFEQASFDGWWLNASREGSSIFGPGQFTTSTRNSTIKLTDLSGKQLDDARKGNPIYDLYLALVLAHDNWYSHRRQGGKRVSFESFLPIAYLYHNQGASGAIHSLASGELKYGGQSDKFEDWFSTVDHEEWMA